MSYCGPVTLTPEQRTLMMAQLAEAQAAFHQLMVGGGVAQLRDQNGETITYTPAKADLLAAYIGNLQRQLGLSTGRARPPMRTFMGR